MKTNFKSLFESIGGFMSLCSDHNLPSASILEHFSNKEALLKALYYTDFDFSFSGNLNLYLYSKDKITNQDRTLGSYLESNKSSVAKINEEQYKNEMALPIGKVIQDLHTGVWKPMLFISDCKLTNGQVRSIAKEKGYQVADLDHLVQFGKTSKEVGDLFSRLDITGFNDINSFRLFTHPVWSGSFVRIYSDKNWEEKTIFLFVKLEKEINV